MGKTHTRLPLSKTQELLSGRAQTCLAELTGRGPVPGRCRPGAPVALRPATPAQQRTRSRSPTQPAAQVWSRWAGRGTEQRRRPAEGQRRLSLPNPLVGTVASVRGSRCFSESPSFRLGPVIGMARECADGCGKRRGASGSEPNGSVRRRLAGRRGLAGESPWVRPGGGPCLQAAEREREGPLACVRPERSGRCLSFRCEFTR